MTKMVLSSQICLILPIRTLLLTHSGFLFARLILCPPFSYTPMAQRPVPRRVPARAAAPAVPSEPPLFYVSEPAPGQGIAKFIWVAFAASVVFHILLAFS